VTRLQSNAIVASTKPAAVKPLIVPPDEKLDVLQVIATWVMLAAPIVPDAWAAEQVKPLGALVTVTAYWPPEAMALEKTKLEALVAGVSVSLPWSESTNPATRDPPVNVMMPPTVAPRAQ
jgi:hypothetical protein